MLAIEVMKSNLLKQE